jgi:dTDP-4-amino-4,6-dideoxygalactose transaminase
VAEYNAAHELSLPLFYGMTEEQINYVIDALNCY